MYAIYLHMILCIITFMYIYSTCEVKKPVYSPFFFKTARRVAHRAFSTTRFQKKWAVNA